ncbi:MAG: hypothetical protein ABIQ82_11505 [Variovorax sp.]
MSAGNDTGNDTGIAARRAWAFVAMAGSVLGAGLQLQQPALWPVAVYACAGLVSLSGLWLLGQHRQRVGRANWLPVLMLVALMGFALAGARAAIYVEGALDPAPEGRALQVLGVVAQMPQSGQGAQRFRLEVKSARGAGKAEDAEPRDLRRWPSTISLGWYAENTGLWGRPAMSATQLDKPPEKPRPNATRKVRCSGARPRSPHTCCWCRTTGARPRRAQRCSMRSSRASRSCRPAIATGTATRPTRSRSDTVSVASRWSIRRTAVPCGGTVRRQTRGDASVRGRCATGTIGFRKRKFRAGRDGDWPRTC